MGVEHYTMVDSRDTVPNSLCNKLVTAYLYEKTSTRYSQSHVLKLSAGELFTAIVASIATAVVLKTTITVTFLKEAFIALGVAVTTGALSVAFNGTFQIRSEIKDYYATISGTSHFTNTITKEYFTMYDTYNGKSTVKYLGEHVSAYGKPTSYQVMLASAIVNWSYSCK